MPNLLTDTGSFEETIAKSKLSVVHFAADWLEQCTQVNDLLDTLSKQDEFANVTFATCNAEDLAEVSMKYKIEAAPTVLFFQEGKELGRVNGVDAAQITEKMKYYCKVSPVIKEITEAKPIEEKLKELTNKSKVMLFMKGSREEPRCGFSKQIVQILNDTGISYETFDILLDPEVRQALKTYSNWPTYPQLYVKGELVGGLDIVKEILAAGELEATLNS